jgi:formate dehydrogenase maturation protein FdhE
MPAKIVKIECFACGHTWHVDLDRLDETELIVYRREELTKTYRAKCPRCDTYNVITIEEEAR